MGQFPALFSITCGSIEQVKYSSGPAITAFLFLLQEEITNTNTDKSVAKERINAFYYCSLSPV
ncbi:MAG: hypothetical protein IPG90_04490 [Bacteroidetes bacterium]|nr:hypothetical protein [Bacteroidota bacterium]